MRVIIILSSILAVYAGVIKEKCNEDEVEILHDDLDRPYLLAVDRSTNIVFFSYTTENEDFQTARINLNTKEFKNIEGVQNGFAQTVDQKTHEVYIGAGDGIYKYNYGKDRAELIARSGTDIWNLYFNDVLYFAVFPSQFFYKLENGQTERFKDLEDTKVDQFVIDSNNTMFFTNDTGLYGQEKGTKNAVLYKEFESSGVRGLATDVFGRAYVCVQDGIYLVDKEKVDLVRVLELQDGFGLAFDNDNNIVYSTASSVVRVKAKLC